MARTKMSREERAKQFMPFAALKGYPEALQKKEKIVVPKVELSEDYQEGKKLSSQKWNSLKIIRRNSTAYSSRLK